MKDKRLSRASRARAGAVAAALLAVGLVACGDGGREETSTTVQGAAGTPPLDAALAAAYRGTDGPLPRDGPRAQPGKTVWAIACTMAATGCADGANGVAAAGRRLGWTTRVIDGKVDPAVQGGALRSAAAAGVDAVVLVGVDCGPVASSLEQTSRAGVKLYGVAALDCDSDGGERLFDGTLSLGRSGLYETVRKEHGYQMADYVIAKTGGRAEVIQLDSTDIAANRFLGEGFRERMAQCADCRVHRVVTSAQDFLQNRMRAITTAALTQHPTANAVVVVSDPSVTLGTGAAVAQAEAGGREILLGSVGGSAPNLEMIAGDGPQDFTVGVPTTWLGWAAADDLNRMFAGEPPADHGIGSQVIDKDNPSPSALDDYDGNARSTRYAENYERIWNGG